MFFVAPRCEWCGSYDVRICRYCGRVTCYECLIDRDTHCEHIQFKPIQNWDWEKHSVKA